ncbi:MAG: HEAT repeat domain-containing protein [Desulforegulaceae bacterium]|nr:HEAT repeat domain-containing protein [Desulforegulaceae bacterium]
MSVKPEEFIDELKFCIKENDLVKAKALIQFFPGLDEKNQTKTLLEISRAPDEISYPCLVHIIKFEIKEPSIKKRLYSLLIDKFFNHGELIVKYLKDPKVDNKIILIRIAGELQISDAVPALNDILVNETNVPTLTAAIRALASIGSTSTIRKIADFLYFGHTGLKTEAVNALSKLGGPSAINLLGEAITGETEADLLIVDKLAEVQDHYALSKLIQLLNSHSTSIRNRAIDNLVNIGEKAVPMVIENLKCEDDDSTILTLNVLGSIGDKSAIQAISKLLFKHPENPNIRFAAYEALEKLPSDKAAISLAKGLQDLEKQVRMSAARAIDKNLSPILVAGIKNMVSSMDAESKEIVATIIDSGADRIFEQLIKEKNFANLSIIHLSKNAHPDTREHFTNLLAALDQDEVVEKIMASTDFKDTKKLLTVFAVDDSKMMLRIYKQKLHQMGLLPVLFEFPSKAIEAMENEKPDLLITDLNMPEINGLELTKKAREFYRPEELPIIMVTTQSDFIGQTTKNRLDSKKIKESGINIVINKPFRDEDLKDALDKLLKK